MCVNHCNENMFNKYYLVIEYCLKRTLISEGPTINGPVNLRTLIYKDIILYYAKSALVENKSTEFGNGYSSILVMLKVQIVRHVIVFKLSKIYPNLNVQISKAIFVFNTQLQFNFSVQSLN